MTRVLIIGAGASGMASAIFAARGGAAVTVLEQNEKPCRKLLATGNGRCNLTNLDQRPEYYRGNEPDFPWKVIQNFDVKETRKFFEELGIYIRSKGGYLYPYSEQAASVAEVLLMEAVRLKVKIKTLERVVCVKKTEYGFSAATQTWEYAADRLILACGSPASMIEGSCGDAIEFAKTFGHSSSEFLPALAGLRGSGLSFAKWAGVRMQGSAALFIENQKAAQETGELQFTDYGISGIPVFQLSRHAVKAVSEQKKVAISLDLMPAFTKEKLTAYLRERRLQNLKKILRSP